MSDRPVASIQMWPARRVAEPAKRPAGNVLQLIRETTESTTALTGKRFSGKAESN